MEEGSLTGAKIYEGLAATSTLLYDLEIQRKRHLPLIHPDIITYDLSTDDPSSLWRILTDES
jgi:hypothetical protein